jgi:phage-related protein/predicted XRE-type DNA-binding protein
MRRRLAPGEKPLFWIGSSKRDLLAMPDPVVRQMGAALSVAQYGGKHPDARPWKGLGSGVFEVVSDYKTDTFRAGYVVRFEHALYVLHCFQKKSPSGTRTAKTDVEMIERRLKAAQEITRRGMAKQAKSVNKVVASSGNVFADLGLPDAAELDTKVRLAVAVNRLLESRRLTQAAAATALSINQPKISALKHYKLEGFSVERLMTFLTALGSDIEIRVHLPRRSTSPGRILVNAA